MKDVLDTVDGWVAEGGAVALATVVETKKSAPQPLGAKMAVNDDGRVIGAVSGGCVEGAVVVVAEGVIAGDDPQLLDFGIADEEAWDVGLPCGGEIWVWVEQLRDRRAAGAVRRARARRRPRRAGHRARRPGRRSEAARDRGRQRERNARRGGARPGGRRARAEALWSELPGRHEHEGVALFVDVVAPPPRLLIFGAVDFATQLAALARLSGWRPFVIDPRSRFATCERFPEAEDVIAAWPDEAIQQLGAIDRATWIAVLTHDPKLDDAILEIALPSDAAYIGAMGSRRAQEKRRERLLAEGIDEALLDRLAAPIGLDLGATNAEDTAVSIMAEMIAARNGRHGGRLSDHDGAIHEAPAQDPRGAAPRFRTAMPLR